MICDWNLLGRELGADRLGHGVILHIQIKDKNGYDVVEAIH